jgi:hypothetical protein
MAVIFPKEKEVQFTTNPSLSAAMFSYVRPRHNLPAVKVFDVFAHGLAAPLTQVLRPRRRLQ